MGFEAMFRKKEVPVAAAEANDNEAGVDTEEIARKLETYSDTELTPPSMGRQKLLEQRENILKVEDPGERSVLEGKYDKAATRLWIDILRGGENTRPLADAMNEEKQSQNEQNLADIKAFPFFDTHTMTEMRNLAQLKHDGKTEEYLTEQQRIERRERGDA